MMKKMTMHEEMLGIGESRHIPYGAAGAIPFRWEKEPGKPIMENPYSDTSLPPLSPPPNRLFSFDSSSSCSSCSSNFSYGRHSWATTPRLITRKVIHIFNHKFLRKPTSNPIVRPPPIPKTKSLPSKLGLHMLKPKPKPEPNPSTESKKNKGEELYEPNNNEDASSTNLSQVLNPNSNSHSHELLSYSSSSSSSSSSSYHSSSSVSCENVEVVPRRSGGGGIVAINVHDDEFGCGCKSRPYTVLDMLTYSNPSSPLINLRRSSCGVNYSGPVNPSHYGMLQGPSVSLTKDEHVKAREDEEEVEDHQTTFAEVVAASAQMFGPPDNYGSFNNSTLGCMPCRSHIGRIAHNLWPSANV